jgi:aminoglycoside phosphotransferase (APT) family kinase protein
MTSELTRGTVAPLHRRRFGDTGAVSLETSLLEVLRRRSGVPGLEYRVPPVPVTGGFWADILAVRLEGAPPELDGDLIVRIMPDTGVAERETIVQQEVVAQGFPAPRVRMTGTAEDGLGRPFMVMDRVPGRPPLPEVTGTGALAGVGRAAIRLPDLLARTAAHLHSLDPAPLRRSLAQVPGAIVDVNGFLALLEERAGGADRPDLVRAARRMAGTRPASDREAICHGDLHPFNLLVDGDRVTVIDWSLGMIADPAFDLAFTALTMALAPINIPRALRGPVRAGARQGSRHFLRRYRHHALAAGASLSAGVLDWHTALHCLRALVEVAEWVKAGTADDKAGHPWLIIAPQMAVRLGAVVGLEVRPM